MKKIMMVLGIMALMLTSCKEEKTSEPIEVTEDDSVENAQQVEDKDTMQKLKVDSAMLEDKKAPLQLETEKIETTADVPFENEEANQLVIELEQFIAKMSAANKAGDETLKQKLRDENRDLISNALSMSNKLSGDEKTKWQAKMNEIINKMK